MNKEQSYYIIEQHKNYYKVYKETGIKERVFII